MKKRVALLLVLSLFPCALTFAAAEAPQTVDLADFTVDADPAYLFETAKKSHNAIVFRASAEGTDAELQIRWRAEPLLTGAMTEGSVAFWADWHLQFIENDFAWNGDEGAACDLITAGLTDVGGRKALIVRYVQTVNGVTLYRTDVLAGGVYGYWIFTGCSAGEGALVGALEPLLTSVRWADSE